MYIKSLRSLGHVASPSKLICLAKRSYISSPSSSQTSSSSTKPSIWNRRELSYLCAKRPQLKWTLIHLLCDLRTRYWIWRLRRYFDQEFCEQEFLCGTREAAAVMIEAIRLADWTCICNCCTSQGASDIYSLAQNKKPLMDLIRFQSHHLRQAVPINVVKNYIDGKCYIYVDMAFIGLRNMKDFATTAEQDEMLQLMQNVLKESQMPEQIVSTHSRVVMAEILITFRRQLTKSKTRTTRAKSNDRKICESGEDDGDGNGNGGNGEDGWLVDSYKVFRFKLVNYSPVTMKCRVIEFLKPV